MVKKLLTSYLLFLIAAPLGLFAQGSLSGVVTDETTGETLIGAYVSVQEAERVVSTNANGRYEITNLAAGTYNVEVTYVGYKKFTTEVTVGNTNVTLDIELKPDFFGLEEVIVTGYQTKTREKSSVSATVVGAEGVQNRPNTSVAQSLTGQVAGLNITTTSGQPGGNSTINLRGVSSINGNTEPLFILDGTPIDEDNFRSLNPNEIESITVLKDAGATAIYGNRGANGVILITTSGGDYNTGLNVTYSGQLNITQMQEYDYDLMNAQEQLRFERTLGAGRGAGMTDEEIANTPNTDWVDFFFDPGISNTHTLTFSNGRENVATVTSIGYTDQDGLLENSGLERYNFRNNLRGRSDDGKFLYSFNSSVNFSSSDEPNNIGGSGINRNPVLAAYQSLPYISPDEYVDGAGLLSPLSFANTPLFIMDLQRTFTRVEEEKKLLGSVNLSYEIVDGLVASGTFGGDYTDEDRLRAEGPESFNALLFAQGGNNTPGWSEEISTQTFTYNALASLNYDVVVDEVHSIGAGAYFETFQGYYDQGGYFAEGLNPKTFEPGDGAGYVGDNAANDFFVDTGFATERQSGLMSYFGTLDYDYDSRYGIDFTIRNDASYRFVESNRWGTFYSVGARWNIANEEFMENSDFNILKLRGSFGKTGNQRIVDATGQFAYFSAPDLTLDLYGTGAGYSGQNSIFLSQIGNRDLRWENVYQGNIGIDLEMFDSRFRTYLDVYLKRTTDLFQNRPVSAINSVTSLRANVGELENRGLDFQVEYDVFREFEDGIGLTIGLVGNYNKQEVLDLPTPEGEVITGLTGLREGGIIDEYYVYRYAGVNPDNGELLFLTADGEVTENPDVDNDRVWLDKNIYPDVEGSINLSVDYKGAYLETQWQYALGVYRYDFDYSGYLDADNIGQFRHSNDILDYWTEDNTDASMPALFASNRGLSGSSDRFLEKADYLRLRFVSLGYNIPAKYLQPINLKGASIYANAENLFTFTEWKGFDPEALSPTGSRLYPSPRIISFGIQIEL